VGRFFDSVLHKLLSKIFVVFDSRRPMAGR
jgi:hypothetical protein